MIKISAKEDRWDGYFCKAGSNSNNNNITSLTLNPNDLSPETCMWKRITSVPLGFQIRVQCDAFRKGLADVVNIEWLRMFNSNELQVLISGAAVSINLEDLKQHTNYSGKVNRYIKVFS